VGANAGGRGARVGDARAARPAAALSPHQRPRRIAVVDELPRTATGKVQRFLLKQRIEQA
jgi:acyl-coenzyme A synthetase/AMP-(fatty) acid ligase